MRAPAAKRPAVWGVLLVIYLVLLFVFVVVKFDGLAPLRDRMRRIEESRTAGHWNINLTPFSPATRHYFKNLSDGYARLNIAGNILPFAPLGFLWPSAFPRRRRFFPATGACLLVILGIEVFQFSSMTGYFDVDDIWMNLLGCLLGYGAYAAFAAMKRRRGATIVITDS